MYPQLIFLQVDIGEIVLTTGKKRGEVHAELRGELFGILDFIKAEETSRPAGFMPAVIACPPQPENIPAKSTT